MVLFLLILGGRASATGWRDLVAADRWPESDEQVRKRVLELYRKALGAKGRVKRELFRLLVSEVDSGLRKEPTSAFLWYLKGAAEYDLGHYDRAARALLRARALDSQGAFAREVAFRLGVIRVYQGRCDLAVPEYLRSLELETDGEAKAIVASNTAECYMTLGRLEAAIVFYRLALEFRPGYPGALWGLAVALDRAEHITEAREAARAGLAADRRLDYIVGQGVFFVPAGEVHYYLGMAYEAGGKKRRAVGAWRAFLESRQDSPWRYRAVQHLIDLGVRPRAVRVLGLGTLWVDGASMGWDGPQGRWLLARVRRCFRGRRLGADAEATVAVQVDVGPDGTVEDAAVAVGRAGACVLGALKRDRWPAWARGRRVRARFAVRLAW